MNYPTLLSRLDGIIARYRTTRARGILALAHGDKSEVYASIQELKDIGSDVGILPGYRAARIYAACLILEGTLSGSPRAIAAREQARGQNKGGI
jgi:hypothetical protein